MQQTKTRCENFKLARSSNVANDLKVCPSSGVIKVFCFFLGINIFIFFYFRESRSQSTNL